MRLALPSLLLLLTACAPLAGRCDMNTARDIAFTSADARERIVARSFGPSCDKAVGVFAIEDREQRPLWSWSAPLDHAFGNVFPPTDREAMRDFLTRWAAPELATTQAAPEFALLAPGQTTLDRVTYEDLRARNVPMLCHFSGSNRQTCVFWESAAGAAGHFYDRDAPEPDGGEHE